MLAPSQSRAGHLILLWAMSSASSMNALVTVHTENIATSSRVEMVAWGQTARYLTPYSMSGTHRGLSGLYFAR